MDGEGSGGHLGPGGKVGTSFLYSERTSYYLNYSLENEQTDNGLLLHGSQGNLVSGVKTRLSDTSSVYVEERYQNGGAPSRAPPNPGNKPPTKKRRHTAGTAAGCKPPRSQTPARDPPTAATAPNARTLSTT